MKFLSFFMRPSNSSSMETTNAILMAEKLRLQNKLAIRDERFSAREKEFQGYLRDISEMQLHYSVLIKKLEKQIESKDREFQLKLNDVIKDMMSIYAGMDAELKTAKNKEQELLRRISSFSYAQKELRKKINASRESELIEKIKLLNSEREQFAAKELALIEKLSNAENEIIVLRSYKDTNNSGNISQNVTKGPPTSIKNEIEIWRSIVDLKQNEILDLKKRNIELESIGPALQRLLRSMRTLRTTEKELRTSEIEFAVKEHALPRQLSNAENEILLAMHLVRSN